MGKHPSVDKGRSISVQLLFDSRMKSATPAGSRGLTHPRILPRIDHNAFLSQTVPRLLLPPVLGVLRRVIRGLTPLRRIGHRDSRPGIGHCRLYIVLS